MRVGRPNEGTSVRREVIKVNSHSWSFFGSRGDFGVLGSWLVLAIN